MQFIAEVYDLLRRVGGLEPEGLAEVFGEWNQGPLESFLRVSIVSASFVQSASGTWLWPGAFELGPKSSFRNSVAWRAAYQRMSTFQELPTRPRARCAS